MARNESHWAPKVRAPPVTEIHEVDAITALGTEVDVLTRKFEAQAPKVMLCETCGGGHNVS